MVDAISQGAKSDQTRLTRAAGSFQIRGLARPPWSAPAVWRDSVILYARRQAAIADLVLIEHFRTPD